MTAAPWGRGCGPGLRRASEQTQSWEEGPVFGALPAGSPPQFFLLASDLVPRLPPVSTRENMAHLPRCL